MTDSGLTSVAGVAWLEGGVIQREGVGQVQIGDCSCVYLGFLDKPGVLH